MGSPNTINFTTPEQVTAIEKILAERVYQDSIWGPTHDRTKETPETWRQSIADYSTGTGQAAKHAGNFEVQMIKTAALALAALEALYAGRRGDANRVVS